MPVYCVYFTTNSGGHLGGARLDGVGEGQAEGACLWCDTSAVYGRRPVHQGHDILHRRCYSTSDHGCFALVLRCGDTHLNNATQQVASIRGVPRHGFDFDVTFSWTCELGHDEDRVVKGTVHCPDASRAAVGPGDGPDDLSYTFKTDKTTATKCKATAKEEAALHAAGKELRGRLFAVLQQLDSDMLKRLEEQAAGRP